MVLLIRTVSVGSTCLPMRSETRLGATGTAQARPSLFVTVKVPSSDCVAPCRLPVSFSWPGTQGASAGEDVAAPAAPAPSPQQAAIRTNRFTTGLKHRAGKDLLNARHFRSTYADVARKSQRSGPPTRAASDMRHRLAVRSSPSVVHSS